MEDLIVAALLPIVAYLYIIYKVDRFDKEPKQLLIKLFVIGGLSVIPIIIVESILSGMNVFSLLDTDLKNFYTAFVVAAFTEELFKWMIVKKFAYRDRAYDERMDGIIYSVYVSLGFAAVENIMYVVTNGNMTIAMYRAITAIPGHMFFGVVMGFYLSRQKFASTRRGYNAAAIKSLVMPILVHGIYDYILMSKYKELLILFIPYLVWLWFFGIKRIRRYYKFSKERHHST